LGHVIVNGRIISNWITSESNMWRMGRIKIPKSQGSVGGLNMIMKPRNPGNVGISYLAERLSGSEQRLYFMDLDNNLLFT
jgi:hypothetical protein